MQTVHKDTLFTVNVFLMCTLSLLMFTCWQVLEMKEDLAALDTKVEELKDQPVAEIIIEEPPTIYLGQSVYRKEAQEPTIFTERDNWNAYIDEVASSYGLSPQLIKSLIQVESRWDPNAVDPTGSYVGLMQISTRWQADRAKRLGVMNMMDPYGNILIGTSYLADTLKETGDLAWALMIYNEGYKSAYQKHCAGVVSAYASEVMKGATYA